MTGVQTCALPIYSFQQKFPGLEINDAVLDLGCGPCDISRRFVSAYPQCTIHGVDAAANMLRHARALNLQHNIDGRIQLIEGQLPQVSLPQNFYHTIISNSLLHHLHNPFVLWESIQEHAKPFANIFIMDLMHPATETAAEELMTAYAADEPKILQQDFYHSQIGRAHV